MKHQVSPRDSFFTPSLSITSYWACAGSKAICVQKEFIAVRSSITAWQWTIGTSQTREVNRGSGCLTNIKMRPQHRNWLKWVDEGVFSLEGVDCGKKNPTYPRLKWLAYLNLDEADEASICFLVEHFDVPITSGNRFGLNKVELYLTWLGVNYLMQLQLGHDL